MRHYPLGRAATEGIGPIRYTLRVPVWPGDNVSIHDIKNLLVGDVHRTEIAGLSTLIEKCDHFVIVRILDFSSIQAAEAIWSQLTIALIRLSSVTGAALQFPTPLTEIARRDDPNIRFREQIRETEYPSNWTRRADGTMTDGGIFPVDACILPEHERIWEYPISFGKILRIVDLSQLGEYLSKSKNFPVDVTKDHTILMASQALWLACTANDRRIQFILLVTTLDILASNEDMPNWTSEIREIILSIQDTIRLKSAGAPEGILAKLSRKIEEIGTPGMADRIRNLVLRALWTGEGDAQKSKNLIKEVNRILGKRAALAHGGKFLSVPTADENERLRKIVAAALDQRMRDSSV